MNKQAGNEEKPKHEMSDVHVGTLAKFIVILAVSVVVVLVAMQIFSNFLERLEESRELPPASRVNPGVQRLPPEPRLQGAPGSQLLPLEEMKKFRGHETAALTNYGWVSKEAGVVRLPIEEAKRIYLERLKAGIKPGQTPAAGASPSPTPAATQQAAPGRSQ